MGHYNTVTTMRTLQVHNTVCNPISTCTTLLPTKLQNKIINKGEDLSKCLQYNSHLYSSANLVVHNSVLDIVVMHQEYLGL